MDFRTGGVRCGLSDAVPAGSAAGGLGVDDSDVSDAGSDADAED